MLVDITTLGVSNNGADTTPQLVAAMAQGNVYFPPGNYIAVNADLPLTSKRHYWLSSGASLTVNGGRMSGYMPGGSLDLRIDGDIGFTNTAQRPQLGDWPNMANVPQRGLIEVGGSLTDFAWGINIHGMGRVFGDYVWNNAPGLTNHTHQLNRKGICVVNANRVRVEDLRVHNIHGEAVYWQGNGGIDVQFNKLCVHTVAFDALNFNNFNGAGFVMSDNFVNASFCGIEASTGIIKNNRVNYSWAGLAFGGGGGKGPIILDGNIFQTIFGVGISAEFGAGNVVDLVTISNNVIETCQSSGIVVDTFGELNMHGNSVYNWSTLNSGYAFDIRSGIRKGRADNNLGFAPGGASAGLIRNLGAGVQLGTNTAF